MVAAGQPGENKVTWRIKELDAGTRVIPVMEFQTILEQGVAGFVFHKQNNSHEPLKRWPLSDPNSDEVTIHPLVTKETPKARTEALLRLSFDDLNLLKTLAGLLSHLLSKPMPGGEQAAFDRDPYRSALEKFAASIEPIASAALRFDTVRLKSRTATQDYEHLWFEFENLGFAGQRWPRFEFRLACALVPAGQFGNHPRLEFPESCKSQIESWYAESDDPHGTRKLELRFALPASMDIAVWGKLGEKDRKLIVSLLRLLPAVLEEIRSQGEALRRPWEDWVGIVKKMQEIYAQKIAARQAAASQKPGNLPAPASAPRSAPVPAPASAPGQVKAVPDAPRVKKQTISSRSRLLPPQPRVQTQPSPAPVSIPASQPASLVAPVTLTPQPAEPVPDKVIAAKRKAPTKKSSPEPVATPPKPSKAPKKTTAARKTATGSRAK